MVYGFGRRADLGRLVMALWHAHRVSPNEVRLRARTADDIPVLAASLLEQQAESRYPFRDPLPVPIEEFLHTDDALGAWVADVDGVPVGHVCRVGPAHGFPGADDLNAVCAAAYGCGPGDLTWVSALFVARGARGRGLGRRLLECVVIDAKPERSAPVPGGAPGSSGRHEPVPVDRLADRAPASAWLADQRGR